MCHSTYSTSDWYFAVVEPVCIDELVDITVMCLALQTLQAVHYSSKSVSSRWSLCCRQYGTFTQQCSVRVRSPDIYADTFHLVRD